MSAQIRDFVRELQQVERLNFELDTASKAVAKAVNKDVIVTIELGDSAKASVTLPRLAVLAMLRAQEQAATDELALKRRKAKDIEALIKA